MILVFAEQRDGVLKKASKEAISEGCRIARNMNGQNTVLLVGKGASGAVADAKGFGPDRILVAEGFDAYSPDAYAVVLEQAARDSGSRVILIPATAMGVDLAPRGAARLDAGLVSDIVEIDSTGDKLTVIKPMYSGKALATVTFESDIQMVTLRPNVFPIAENPTEPEVTTMDTGGVSAKSVVSGTELKEAGKVELGEAEIIVSGGRGIKGPENFPMLQELADQLGAALGASRAAVDAGWIDHSHQVGQTGKVVSPKVYIACGISGAIQHLAGMGSSKFIIAINKDADAPIFNLASLGIVGDLFKVVPALKEALAKEM